MILRSAIKVEDIVDPSRPIEALLARVEKEELVKLYRISNFDTAQEFLGQIARKRGMLLTGGIANFDQAARSVIKDYLNGKIKYFTVPPVGVEDDDEDDEEMEDD